MFRDGLATLPAEPSGEAGSFLEDPRQAVTLEAMTPGTEEYLGLGRVRLQGLTEGVQVLTGVIKVHDLDSSSEAILRHVPYPFSAITEEDHLPSGGIAGFKSFGV